MRTPSVIALTLFLGPPLVASAAGIRDYSTHSPPSITMPTAGNSYIDPVFGTKIIRVTDSRYGTRCVHAYSYWPAFNYNSTRLLLACDNKALLFRFDPATDRVTPDGTLQGDTGYKVTWEGAVWSQHVPDTIYAVDQTGSRLWRINVAKRGASGYTLLKDFSNVLGTSVYIHHLTVDEDADYFSFHTRSKATGERLKAVVWDRHNNRTVTYLPPSNLDLDESKISKSGEYVHLQFDDGTTALWNWSEGTRQWFYPESLSDNSGGHWDIGKYYIMNSDVVRAGMAGRTFDDLRPAEHVVRYKRRDGTDNWTLCDHVSLRTKNEEFFIGSTYAGDGSWSAFEKEIYLGYTDGSGFVRLAHSRSKGTQSSSDLRYRSQPRAVVDRMGHYVVYTSDLGSSTRHDVMILKIPSSLWPD